MGSSIIIRQSMDKGYSVMMNPEMAASLGLDKKCIVPVSYGTQKCYASMSMRPDAGQSELYLSRKIIDYLHLPAFPEFELRSAGGEIVIGPHMGILIERQDENITADRLKGAMKFVSNYPMVNGSIVIFALDRVDRSNRLIEGYCYNPRQNCWERGVFPYPLSIYLWIIPDRSWKNHFLSVIGDRIFNSFYLDKYELYQSFLSDTYMKGHLPETVLYKSGKDIFEMLQKYKEVIVKPIAGFHGIGVACISPENSGIAIRYRKDGMNIEEHYEKNEGLNGRFGSLFVPEKYIVQQRIDLLTHDGSVMDFRLVMQKGSSGKWICRTIVGRIGDSGSVVSNVSNGARPVAAFDLFINVLNFPYDKAREMEEMLRKTGFEICDRLCSLGINYGNLGLDIGIDNSFHPYLLEVNSRRPDPLIAMGINDRKLYRDIYSGPLLYARFLALF